MGKVLKKEQSKETGKKIKYYGLVVRLMFLTISFARNMVKNVLAKKKILIELISTLNKIEQLPLSRY